MWTSGPGGGRGNEHGKHNHNIHRPHMRPMRKDARRRQHPAGHCIEQLGYASLEPERRLRLQRGAVGGAGAQPDSAVRGVR